jgi:hypothetical protein
VTSADVTLGLAELSRFEALFQRGVAVRACARSVLGFLVDEVGLTPEYVRDRITTVFLDGQVVDALDDAVLREGSRLALSAAMPGLVGATLRRSGPYAAMRAEITRRPEHEPDARTRAPVVIQVKLFNMLIHEVGPALLVRGVLLERDALGALGLPPDPKPGWPGGTVELRVRFG